MTRLLGTVVSFGESRRTSQRVLREVRRGFFCDVVLHAKPDDLSAQTRYLHLLGRDPLSLLTIASTAKSPLADSLTYPQ